MFGADQQLRLFLVDHARLQSASRQFIQPGEWIRGIKMLTNLTEQRLGVQNIAQRFFQLSCWVAFGRREILTAA